MPTEPLAVASEDSAGDGPPRAFLIAAVIVAVVAIGAVLAIAATRKAPVQPVVIAAAPAPQAAERGAGICASCRRKPQGTPPGYP